jgi:hypothetical protein
MKTLERILLPDYFSAHRVVWRLYLAEAIKGGSTRCRVAACLRLFRLEDDESIAVLIEGLAASGPGDRETLLMILERSASLDPSRQGVLDKIRLEVNK